MIGIVSNEIRELLKLNLKANSLEVGCPTDELLRIQDLDNIFKISRKIRAESKKEIKEKLGIELSIVNLNIICCFLISVSLSGMTLDFKETILPKSLWKAQKISNPDTIFKTLITQITQHSISIVELVSLGLDGSARSLSRTTAELSWQTLILLAFKEDLLLYQAAHTSEETTETWFRLFGKGRTQKKLTQIEEMLGIHSDVSEKLATQRKDNNQFFSESVHSGYLMTVVSTIRWSFEEDAGAWSALGGSTSASETTLGHLSMTLDYFCEMFILILNEIHHLYPEIKSENWRDFLLLQESISEAKLRRP